MSSPRRVRIVSNGDFMNTKVLGEDGKEIPGVRDIVIQDFMKEVPTARIEFVQPEIDIVANAEFTDVLWNDFEAWERQLSAAGSGLTREHMTGACAFYSWLKQRYSNGAADVTTRSGQGWKQLVGVKKE